MTNFSSKISCFNFFKFKKFEIVFYFIFISQVTLINQKISSLHQFGCKFTPKVTNNHKCSYYRYIFLIYRNKNIKCKN